MSFNHSKKEYPVMKNCHFLQNCRGSAVWYAVLIPGLCMALVVILNSMNQKNRDVVSATLSSSRSASSNILSQDRCIFQCSELLRADSRWPTITTVKTLCKKKNSCPNSHPVLSKKQAYTSMTQESPSNKLHYLWVQEYYCCRQ